MLNKEWLGIRCQCEELIGKKIAVELTRCGEDIKNLELDDDGIVFAIKKCALPKIKSLEEQYQVTFLTIKHYGAGRVLNTLKLRAGLVIGLLLGLVIVLILSNFTLNIKIRCDNDLYYGKVEQTLQKSGLKVGLPLSKVDSESLESAILTEIEETVFVTVYVRGVTVYVEVISVPATEVFPNDKASIKSLYQSVISRVIVTSGTACVVAGQTVNVGDTLIEGYINTNKSDWQEAGQEVKVEVEASGEIYGKCYYHKRIYLADTTILTRRTGNSKIRRQMYLGALPLDKPPVAPYQLCESVTTYSIITGIVPIKVITTTYYELEEYTLDKVGYTEYAIAAAKGEIMDELPQGAKVLNEQRLPADGGRSMDYYIEVEQRIDDGGYNYSYSR